MGLITTSPITANECGIIPLLDITKDDDWLVFLSQFVFMLRNIITCEVQCVDEDGDEDMVTLAGDTLPELATTPSDILSNLLGERILLPLSLRESLQEWDRKIAPYTAKTTLINKERDEVAKHLVHLTRFLFEEVVNPALKNTYPSTEIKIEIE